MINVSIKIKADDPERLRDALIPDIEDTDRFKVRITAEKKHLLFKLKAKDLTAARAAVNSYLRLANIIDELEEEQWS